MPPVTEKTNGASPGPLPAKVIARDIGEEMRSSYIDYAMSVIVGRALPDVRDGLKPVHRRILYTMEEMGLRHSRPYRKSARVVGDVLGKYHPHGDMAVYEALVRMVQDFSLRHPLVDGQGNFGSVDGDPPAAMRYTEVRLARIADEILADIEKQTVEFAPNYDGSLQEPLVLPARLPNLLVNGSSGIAVGMATNIPPHNLGEVCDALVQLIGNPKLSVADLAKTIKGPDFPTYGILQGRSGVQSYFETGRGMLRLRAKTLVEPIRGGKEAIILTELPYQVNKALLLEHIAELVRDRRLDDISDLRDESDRRGIRVVIELKRDANSQIVLNQLFKNTQMEASFGVILLALADGRPRVLNLKELLQHYLEHRKSVVTRRTRYELQRAQERAHVLEGLQVALKYLNKVIKIIRESKDALVARGKLMARYDLSQIQAQAILDMRLHQLTRLEGTALQAEHAELLKIIGRLKGILGDPRKVLGVIEEELKELKVKYAQPRRTQIAARVEDLSVEDLIVEEEVVVCFTHSGYVKRMPVDTYRAQGRGGKGITGMLTKDNDFVERLFVTSTHATLLLFTTRGRVYSVKVYDLPDASRTSRGKAIVNAVALGADEKLTSFLAVKGFGGEKDQKGYVVMCTRKGTVKKTPVAEFDNIRRSGIAAINLEEGDVLVDAAWTDGSYELLIATVDGMCIRFPESDVRSMGRVARGVRGIRLSSKDQVLGMAAIPDKMKATLLAVCENGYGKRTDIAEYRGQHRGGGGVIAIKSSERNGPVVGAKVVTDKDDVMIMTEQGMAIRLHCKEIRVISRNTQGVRLVKLQPQDRVAAVEPVVAENGRGL